MTHYRDQPRLCDACSSNHHTWTAQVAEDLHGATGRLVTIYRNRCDCPLCACTAGNVRVEPRPHTGPHRRAKAARDDPPTEPLPAQTADQPEP